MKLEDLEAKLGIANMGEEDKLALVKDIQANLPALKAEQRVLEAKTQANLVVEAIKKIKEGLETRFDELNGIVDAKVRDITSGKNGIDGKDGKNGKDGKDGKDGLSITGPKGADGEAGQDGVGVQDAHIDFDGSLIITLTDGRELNVGEVVPMDVAEKIKVIGNGGGTSQSVLDSLTSLQNQINTLTGIDGTLGTMAQQDDTAVDINGGAIDGTTVGSTTPAAGTFTTLTATGQTSLGGVLNSETVRVLAASSSTSWLEIGNTATGSTVYAESSSGNKTLALSSRGTTGVVSLRTNAGNEQMRVSHTASAVNYVQVTGAATGSTPTLSVQGSDAAVGLTFNTKSTGVHTFQTNGTTRLLINSGGTVQLGYANATPCFTAAGVASQVNGFQVAGSVAGSAPVLSSTGSDTNISLVLQPKGTGALQAQQTDSTATGGNARGANAVDWQTYRTTAAQVASGAQSVITGGYNNTVTAGGPQGFIGAGAGNTVSGLLSSAISGNANQAQKDYSVVVGGNTNIASGVYNFIGGGASNSGTSGSVITTQSGTMNGTTAVTLSGSNASIKVGQILYGTYISYPATYVAAVSGTSLTLSQAASGSGTATLSFLTPHGVVVGGGNNQATGSYSFIGGGGDAGTAANRNVASGDWSTVAGGQKGVASGFQSTVGGGFNQTASGTNSTAVGGYGNSATALYSSSCGGAGNAVNSAAATISGGLNGTTRAVTGYTAFPSCYIPVANAVGVSQGGLLILGKQTTDATATVITSDGGAAGTTNQVILPNNSAYYFKGTVVAGVTGAGNTSSWSFEGTIKRGANAASTTLVGTPVLNLLGQDSGASAWVVALTADTTNGGLAVTVTGQASTTIRWVCKVETTEMTY